MLDKFNTSTFALEVTSVTGQKVIERQYSPRVAILGSQTYSQEGHGAEDRTIKIADEPSNTVCKQVSRMEVSLILILCLQAQVQLGFDLLQQFRQHADVLRNDTDILMNQLIEQVENSYENVKPEIYADYKKLKSDIKDQRFEKELLQKEIDMLRRQTEEQRAKVAYCQQRLYEMEEQVGMIANTKAYQEDFDLDEEVSLKQLEAAFKPKIEPVSNTVSRQLLNIKSSQKDLHHSVDQE